MVNYRKIFDPEAEQRINQRLDDYELSGVFENVPYVQDVGYLQDTITKMAIIIRSLQQKIKEGGEN